MRENLASGKSGRRDFAVACNKRNPVIAGRVLACRRVLNKCSNYNKTMCVSFAVSDDGSSETAHYERRITFDSAGNRC